MNDLGYVAAGAFPIKLVRCKDAIIDGRIVPYHLQLFPTNRCNKNCPFCSCLKIDRRLELSFNEIKQILDYFRKLGSKAITISGGGEPTLHQNLNDILLYAKLLGYEIGLVSNGVLWSKKGNFDIANNTLTWSRLSVTDDTINNIEIYANNLLYVDVGLSYVVVEDTNVDNVSRIFKVAESIKNLTHIRLVTNINKNKLENVLLNIKNSIGYLSTKAIYQCRDESVRGTSNCLISLLKPVIAADGYLYPCCGVQYASGISLDMPKQYRMGKWSEYEKMVGFNGSICDKCYYSKYNQILEVLIVKKLKHLSFL